LGRPFEEYGYINTGSTEQRIKLIQKKKKKKRTDIRKASAEISTQYHLVISPQIS
jgi:hypothetical protein